MTENQNNEIKTLRLADVLLFLPYPTLEDEVSCSQKTLLTCEGMESISFEKDSVISILRYRGEISKENGEGCTKISSIEKGKKEIAPVFEKWGIDVEKLSCAIERNYALAVQAQEEIEDDSWLGELFDVVSKIQGYYANYGSEALRVSSLHGEFVDACLNLLADQVVYEQKGNKAPYYDKEHENTTNEVALKDRKAQDDALFDLMELYTGIYSSKTQQEYLTFKSDELLAFGEWLDVRFVNVKTDFGRANVRIRTLGVRLPAFTQIIDNEGNVVAKTDREVVAYWFAPESKFRLKNEETDDQIQVDSTERTLAVVLKKRERFQTLLNNDAEKEALFYRCLARRYSYSKEITCIEGEDNFYNFVNGHAYLIERERYKDDPFKNGYENFKNYVEELVNEQKNYEALPKIRQQDYDRMSEEERDRFRRANDWDQAPQQGITVLSRQPQIGETNAKGGAPNQNDS